MAPNRSLTGNMPLLPAVRPGITEGYLTELPKYTIVQWTFGRGSVIYKIWPSVLFHVLFAVAICLLWQVTPLRPQFPNVMLTVLGVVIGFVISYRASSGYDRYWMGRSAWTEIIRTSRTMARLIHYHVPPRLTPRTPEEIQTGKLERTKAELMKCVGEKNLALDMTVGFAMAVKHHLRGELGIYYEDLYHRVKPLHDLYDDDNISDSSDSITITTATALPPHRISDSPAMPRSKNSRINLRPNKAQDPDSASVHSADSGSRSRPGQKHLTEEVPAEQHDIEAAAGSGETEPLLRPSEPVRQSSKVNIAQLDLVPFGSFFSKLFNFYRRSKKNVEEHVEGARPALKSNRRWGGPVFPKVGVAKGSPRKSGTGEIVPLEICRCLSEWYAVLEERGTVPGTSLGSMLGCIAQLETSLSTLEQILTTPLPFGYAVHIRHTVWIYLIFLPLQLVEEFGWYTVLTLLITSFIFFGFVAAGEEIEQPFGYDENDLDLDLFCQEIVADEIDVIKHQQGLNSYFPSGPSHARTDSRISNHHKNLGSRSRIGRSMTLVDVSESDLRLAPEDPYNMHIEGTIEGTVPSRATTLKR